MAKFKFKMQNILELKEKLENQKKNELSRAIEKLNKYRKQKEDVESAKKDVLVDMKEGIVNKISADRIKKSNDYIAYLKKLLIQLQKNINISEKEVDKRREELLVIVKERKTYEKLKEKEHEEFIKEENMKEQKGLDEVAGYRFIKKIEDKE